MPQTAELAETLIDYDERLAREILELVVKNLGGPSNGTADLDRLRTFLNQVELSHSSHLTRLGDVASSPATTEEWKTEFHHFERMKRLGLALAERLS